MSEIIASVYDLMETTGVRQGILFLDEINCVSETLSPLMMQFLQYKVFGGHRLPEGWIVVTAGNPPEYNDSAREFDIVTLDRLKKMDVEPDFEAWKEYASAAHIHPAVVSFLQSRRERFEKNGIEADEDLIVQYLQNSAAAKEFNTYLALFNKYREEYPVDAILDGEVPEGMTERVSQAGFDEVYTLIGLLLSSVKDDVRGRMEERRLIESVRLCLREYKAAASEELEPDVNMRRLIGRIESGRESGLRAHSLTREEADRMLRTASCLYDMAAKTASLQDYDLFSFAESCWGDEKEMLLIVTELTADPDTVSFISTYGCDGYYRHNKNLLFDERQTAIDQEIEKLEL